VASGTLAPDQKKARRRQALIVFVDETGFSFQARPARTWAPRRRPPVLRCKSQRRQISTIAALAMNGRIYKRHYREAIRGPQVVRMLRHLRSCLGQPLIVIWDRSQAHRARVVKEYLATEQEISVEWLPPYAPELNPEEYCHGNVKEQIRNTTPESVEEMQRQVDRGFNRLRKHPDLLLSFFRHAGLGVKRLT
jgi:transposase